MIRLGSVIRGKTIVDVKLVWHGSGNDCRNGRGNVECVVMKEKHTTLYSLKWDVGDSQNKVRGDLKLNMSP